MRLAAFTKAMQVRSKRDYDRVFAARLRTSRGPISFHLSPNDLPISRFGLSVGRKVGTAVQRNVIRRRMREAFRLARHTLPMGFDIVRGRATARATADGRLPGHVVRCGPQARRASRRVTVGSCGLVRKAARNPLHLMSRVLIYLVLLYRVTLGRLLGGHCRFTPSCSQYAIDAIRKYGPLAGSWRAARRIARCHPWGGCGYDPA